MLIKRLEVRNFKSIKEANIEFTPLAMLVGANASGKSNLINVFRFISNIATHGIDNAIALQGGMPYLANASLEKGTPIEIGFDIDCSNEGWLRNFGMKNFALEIKEIKYKFIIQPNRKGGGYQIASDFLELNFGCVEIKTSVRREERYEDINAKYSMRFERKTAKSSIQSSAIFVSDEETENIDLEEKLKNDAPASFFCILANEDKKELMLYRLPFLLPPSFSENTFIRIFDFDPRELKKSSSMASMRILDENGSNMASVLQNILRTKENRKKLTTILNDFLPFVNGITVENNYDKSFSYKIQENFSNRSYHANFLSDGTVSIIALIIALYFEERSNIIILEEPERNIHPKLLARLLSAAEDVSQEKQIIITTHNPEFLKHSRIENVKLVKRDEFGFSEINSPKDSAVIKCFIDNDLGLDDLFLQDILGE